MIIMVIGSCGWVAGIGPFMAAGGGGGGCWAFFTAHGVFVGGVV